MPFVANKKLDKNKDLKKEMSIRGFVKSQHFPGNLRRHIKNFELPRKDLEKALISQLWVILRPCEIMKQSPGHNCKPPEY